MDDNAIEKWERADLWRLDEFATLCCGYDPHDKLSGGRSDDYYIEENRIRESIRRAVIAGNLSPINEPDKSRAEPAYGYEMFFRPEEAVAWALHRYSAFPNFSKNIARFSLRNAIIQKTQSPLDDNDYWQELQKKALKAIGEFPAWSEKQKKVQWTANVMEWLKKDFALNHRDAHFLKNILSDHYRKNR